jgi:hypothetical protein
MPGRAAVAELVYAMASKAIVLRDLWVRIPPAALRSMRLGRMPNVCVAAEREDSDSVEGLPVSARSRSRGSRRAEQGTM